MQISIFNEHSHCDEHALSGGDRPDPGSGQAKAIPSNGMWPGPLSWSDSSRFPKEISPLLGTLASARSKTPFCSNAPDVNLSVLNIQATQQTFSPRFNREDSRRASINAGLA